MNHKLHIKYFGQIAEITGKSFEIISVDSISIETLVKDLTESYPSLRYQEFKVAVDHEIKDWASQITHDAEIALLPPFAGG
ncbi:MoaD/ThiS family protein [Flavobacteriaceae bacterium]|nr:MoaD/ThiS family protein [Flavobacteriaceae bacterium]